MAPNLFVVAKKICQPQSWFQPKTPVALAKTERWADPVPGLYRHVPVAGWFFIAKEEGPADAPKFRNLKNYRKVDYCRVLHKWMFVEDIEARSRDGFVLHRKLQKTPLKFFLLDDGKTWVQCFSEEGRFLPGPHERFVLDEQTGKFRPMKKSELPILIGRTESEQTDSGIGSLHRKSQSIGTRDKTKAASLSVPDSRPASSRSSTGSRPHSPSPLASPLISPLETPAEDSKIERPMVEKM